MDSPTSIFLRFLKFGALAWGGPAAQIDMIRRECVEEERWVSEETFKKTLAVYQVLPGPEAHELCVYFGRLRGGKLGAFLAGLAFMLPGFVLMLGLSVLYVEADIADSLDEIFYGLKAAVAALVARAVVRLGRSFLSDVPLVLIALAAFAVTVGLSAGFVIVLLGGGLAYEVWDNRDRWLRRAAMLASAGEVFLEGLKVGLLTFGGAYTAIPFVQESSVDGRGWLTQAEFLDGIALGGILPAPLIIFGTFVGYLADGVAGALLMTLGIFLPAFLFPIFLHRWLVVVSENPRIRAFLLGVGAAVVGLIAAVTVDLVDVAIVDVPAAVLALAAFAALYRWQSRLTIPAVVLGCGLVGAALQLTVL